MIKILLFLLSNLIPTEEEFGPLNYEVEKLKLGEGVAKATGECDSLFFFLSDLSVFVDDSLFPKDAYQVDYEKGEVYFSPPLPPQKRIRIKYHRLPFSVLKREYTRYRPREKESVPSGKEKKPTPAFQKSEVFEEETFLHGSKSFGFNYSEEGFLFEQTTDLKLKGKRGETDIELFLQDVGQEATVELRELEAVSLTITAPAYQFTFGDFAKELSFAQFGSVKRKGQGIKLRTGEEAIAGHPKPSGATARPLRWANAFSFIRPKNRFHTLSFFGEEGKKGPYLLTVGSQRVAIVVGSEEVYYNGKRLKRGEDEDYVIDYSLGELTFTNRVSINSSIQITVLFLYESEDYEKSFYSFSSQTPKSEIGGLSLTAFFEEDDRSYNFSSPLTEEEERYLSTIGDDEEKALLSSARYVGRKRGSYEKRGEVFFYVGQDSGDYEVLFTFVGMNEGEYLYDNERNLYYYVGEGRGQFSPKRKISLPKRRQAYSPLLLYSPTPHLRFSLQGLFTAEDKNTFSPVNDDDNLGLGYNLSTALGGERVRLEFTRKGYSRNYFFPEEEEVDFTWRWGEKRDSVKSISTIQGIFSPFSFFSLNLGGGLLQKEGRNVSRIFGNSNYHFLNLSFEKMGKNHRQEVSLQPKWKGFAPSLHFSREVKGESKFLTFIPELDLTIFDQRLTLSWEERRIYNPNATRNQSFKVRAGAEKSLFSYSFLIGLEKIAGEGSTFWDTKISLSNLFGLSGLIEGYSIKKGTEIKEINFIKVEPGKGNYKKDPNTGEYFPHPEGDYLRVVLPTGKIIPGKEVSLKSNTNFTKNPFSLSLNLNLEQKSDTSLIVRRREVNGNFIYSPSDYLLFQFQKGYNYYFDREIIYERSEEGEARNYLSLEITKRLAPFVVLKTKKKFFPPLFWREEVERKVGSKAFFGPTEISFALGEIKGRDFRIKKEELTLNHRLILKKVFNIEIFGEIIQRRSFDSIPYDLTLLEPLGFQERGGLEINSSPGKNLNFSFRYEIVKIPEKNLTHLFSSQLRINF